PLAVPLSFLARRQNGMRILPDPAHPAGLGAFYGLHPGERQDSSGCARDFWLTLLGPPRLLRAAWAVWRGGDCSPVWRAACKWGIAARRGRSTQAVGTGRADFLSRRRDAGAELQW